MEKKVNKQDIQEDTQNRDIQVKTEEELIQATGGRLYGAPKPIPVNREGNK